MIKQSESKRIKSAISKSKRNSQEPNPIEQTDAIDDEGTISVIYNEALHPTLESVLSRRLVSPRD